MEHFACVVQTHIAAGDVAAVVAAHEAPAVVVRQASRLTHHDSYVRQEFACQLGLGALGTLLCCLNWSEYAGLGLYLNGLTNFMAFTFVHIMIHSIILAFAYRLCAKIRTRACLCLGVFTILTYYCVLTGRGLVGQGF